MKTKRRMFLLLGLVAIVVAAGTGAVMSSVTATSGGASGQIDDGAELLDQASISLEDAIAAAQASASGAVGEVDLETYAGTLVFNVDIGDRDVKVDASDGSVLGYEQDDENDDQDDDQDDDQEDD